MADVSAPQMNAQRRFRQRGGAKKKKKHQQPQEGPPVTEHNVPGASVRQPDDPYRGRNQQFAQAHRGEGPQTPFSGHSFHAGGGTQLDPELARYLYQLSEDLQRLEQESRTGYDQVGAADEADDFETPHLLLARNGLQSLQANLHEVAAEPMGSRVLEALIRAASTDTVALAEALSALLARGSRRVSALADHRCGSHVLQALVQAVAASAATGGRSAGNPVFLAMTSLGNVLDEWTVDDVATIMSSSSGSHVFRAIVAGLAGIPAEEPKEQKLDDSAGSSRLSTYIEQAQAQVPDEWLSSVGRLAERLLENDEGGLHNFLWTPCSSAALQCLLAAVSVHDRELAKRLVAAAIQGHPYYDVCIDSSGARFMERVVVCLGAGFVMPQLKGRLAEMARDSKANFVLQRILLAVKGRGAVMSAWDELEPSLSNFLGLSSTRHGVALAMVRAAEVEGDEQARRRAARAIAKSVNAIGARSKFLVGILIMGSLDRWERWRTGVKEWGDAGMGIPSAKLEVDDNSTVLNVGYGLGSLSLLGVLIARSLLRFPGGPGQVCRDSMANLTDHEVLALCCHSIGSRLIDQWVLSDEESGTGKVASSVVCRVLDANAVGALSRSPCGSQVLCLAIPRASGPVRKRAMEALAARSQHLREHEIGRQVLRKCRLDDYVRRGDEWHAVESARDTRQRLFADILTPAENETAELEVEGANEKKREYRKSSKKRMKSGAISEVSAVEKQDNVAGTDGLDPVLTAIAKAATAPDKKKRRKKSKDS